MNEKSPREIYLDITKNIETVIRAQSVSIRKLMAAFVSGGHVLLEDYPGTGKTTLAKALARSVDCRYSRIQFTPDLLPSDILGVSIFDQKDGAFHFHQGPIFTHILLADEINRASPRTQSALLEAMAESQVSIDGKRMELEKIFFVIATQNPVEFRGTYPLPEAQMDRFAMRFSLGYVPADEEVSILEDHGQGRTIENLGPRAVLQDILEMKEAVRSVRVSDELKRYMVEIVRSTRSAPGVQLGASPRASLSLMKTAQALALFDGMDFVTPDHIQELAPAVIAHRLVMAPEARFSGSTAEDLVDNILKAVPVPV
jgi:MoxR-like ATPase